MKTASNDSLGWTGGQYSLLRFLLGLFLAILLLKTLVLGLSNTRAIGTPLDGLMPEELNLLYWHDSYSAHFLIFAFLIFFSLSFALGCKEKLIVPFLLWGLFCTAGYYLPLGAVELDALSFIFIVHIFTPSDPWGSWGKLLSGANLNWRLPKNCWILARCGLAFMFVSDLLASVPEDPASSTYLLDSIVHFFELIFILSHFLPRYLWLGSIFGLLSALLGFGVPVWFLALLTFEPARISAKLRSPITIFYDGPCGLCQRWVNFCLSEDTKRTQIHFSPIQGETFTKNIKSDDTAIDSIIVRDNSGNVFFRSEAVVQILYSLNGIWPALGSVLKLLPKGLANFVYKYVALNRYRIFQSQTNYCPVVPKELSTMFLP